MPTASNSKSLDLRTLTIPDRLLAINGLMAEVFYGWVRETNPAFLAAARGGPLWWGGAAHAVEPPPFASDANIVLPLLEKHRRFTYSVYQHDLTLFTNDGRRINHAFGPSLPFAACVALLRAEGIEVLDCDAA